jgi:hypothetical protein
MTPVQALTNPLHAHILGEARRAGVAIDETHFAWAASPQATIGVAPLRLGADELSDLARGRNVLFVTLTLPPGIDKTTDGVPVADGAYLLNVTLAETRDRVSARLMTTSGREIGVLPATVKPDHPHEDRFAVSAHVGWCGYGGDLYAEVNGYWVSIEVSVAWC